MQQPLCHLYFLTVMERLSSDSQCFTLSTLVRKATYIQNRLEAEEGGEAVLLQLELQAVIQVLIQQLALHLHPSETDCLSDVVPVLDGINKSVHVAITALFKLFSLPFSILADNPTMEKKMKLAHGMVLALHLTKLLMSPRRFIYIMTKYSDPLNKINCLEPIHQQLQVSSYWLEFILWLHLIVLGIASISN